MVHPAIETDRIRWYRTASGFPKSRLDAALTLPDSYLTVLAEVGPGEGFVGSEYLRLYALDELQAVNDAYQSATYLPGHVIIGSNGCGEAFVLDLRSDPPPVIQVPFVPLDTEYAETLAATFAQFWDHLLSAQATEEPFPPLVNEGTLGLEVTERHPIVLGGRPGVENQVLVPAIKHSELARFWNKTFQVVRQRSQCDA